MDQAKKKLKSSGDFSAAANPQKFTFGADANTAGLRFATTGELFALYAFKATTGNTK